MTCRLRGDPPTEKDVRNAIERATVGATRIEILLSESVVAEGQDRVLTQSFRCLALIVEGSLPQGEIPSEFRAATGPGGRSPILSSIAERRALDSASGRAPPPMGSSARDW